MQVAARDHNVQRPVAYQIEHRRKLRLVVLQIGVHDGQIGSGGAEHALDTGGRKPAPANAFEHANARIGSSLVAQQSSRAIGRVVVDEDSLPYQAFECAIQLAKQYKHIGALVVGGNDDRQLQWPGLRVPHHGPKRGE
jgi:hypothetical protein